MSDINVTVTSAGAANVSVSNGSTVSATVGNGGAVNVSLGTISPGNATVVSGTLTINSTTTLAAGSQAYAKNVGTSYAAALDLGIPAGPATTVLVGNTTTLAAGSNATVTGVANGSTLTLSFGIPAGASGAGGTNGVTPSLSIGNVTTLSAGSNATVTATSNGANVTLDFGIPRGANGTGGGSSNLTLSDATPSALGVASAGTSNQAARADHVHQLLTAADVNAITANDVIDGGDYVGVVVTPSGITITQQPQNATATITASAGSWTSRTLPVASPAYFFSVSHGNGTFVATSAGNANYLTSPDAVSWTSRAAIGNTTAISRVYYGGSSFMHADGRTVRSSADGVAWSFAGTLPSSLYEPSVAYGNGLWLAVSRLNETTGAGTTAAATSANGSTWSARTMPIAAVWRSVCFGNGRFVAVGYQSQSTASSASYAATSTDGVSWSYVTLPANAFWWAVAYGNGRFVAIAYGTPGVSGTQIAATSLDGVTWTQRQMPSTSQWSAIQFGNGMFVATSFSSTTDVATSVNGESWTLGTLPTQGSYPILGYGNNTFVAIDPASNVSLTMTPTIGNATALFTVSGYAASGNPVAYQWQKSVDGGGNFANVNGATSSGLTLVNLTTSDNLSLFRAVLSSTGAANVTSNSATLTVTG